MELGVRVLIADDSAFMRKVLREMFEAGRGFEVVGTARDGADAIEKVRELHPDIVTMDIEMPTMNGLTALRKIRAEFGRGKPAVLMCSTLTQSGSETALNALQAGAADVIAKEHLGIGEEHAEFRDELLSKVREIGMQVSRASRKQGPNTGRRAGSASGAGSSVARSLSSGRAAGVGAHGVVRTRDLDAVVIGSSTGGPPVLESIVSGLRGRPTKPIFIAQHMPEIFTRSLATRLDGITEASVKLAEDGERVENGTIYIAEGGKHLRIGQRRGSVVLEVSEHPSEALYKPSVNELFASAASVYGMKTLGVMLTGMGDDGTAGSKPLHASGAQIVAQSPASCVVYGMPRSVVEARLATAAMGIEEICSLVSVAAGCPGASQTPHRKSA